MKTRRTPKEVRLDLATLMELGWITADAESTVNITGDGAKALKLVNRNPSRYVGEISQAIPFPEYDIDAALTKELKVIQE